MTSMMSGSSIPFVSVWMCTYNHAEYIAEAIEGVVGQCTDFPFRLFISDDASTDGTRELCLEYQRRYPDMIELILPEENTNIRVVLDELYPRCLGSGAKYIAMCEGDDYWTDPHKLQKQVDVMEADPSISLVLHRQNVVVEEAPEKNFITRNACGRQRFGIEEALRTPPWGFTASMVYRNPGKLPEWFRGAFSGEIALLIWNASLGDVFFMDDIMSVYRRHQNGISVQRRKAGMGVAIGHLYRMAKRYLGIKKYFNGKYDHILDPIILDWLENAMRQAFATREWSLLGKSMVCSAVEYPMATMRILLSGFKRKLLKFTD